MSKKTKRRKRKRQRYLKALALTAVTMFLLFIGVYVGLSPPKSSFVEISDSDVPLADTDRDALNEKNLISALSKMESGQCVLDNTMTVNEAQLFGYEFYALHPEITLCYSPRFGLLGYDQDTNICVGYRVRLISEESGKLRYEELLNATEGIIEELKNEPDDKKIRGVYDWMRWRCSYTKNPRNMWDECLYGCLVDKTATCLGYSEGFLYMMDRLHVPCRIVRSKYHAWNEVFDGKKWIKIDVTRA